MIISNATIYGYFTIKYTGEHKHSSNVSMSNGDVTKYICGCGKIHETDYSISPNQWGFDGRYYFHNEGIKTSIVNINDLTITSERLRCGYIENEFVNLSPNRYNAGDAYLKLSFSEPIYGINTNLSYWSNNEMMYPSDGDYAYIKYLDKNGNWSVLLDILNSNLSTDRLNQNYFELNIPDGTKTIIFEDHKANPNTDRNKGRISIGNTIFIKEN